MQIFLNVEEEKKHADLWMIIRIQTRKINETEKEKVSLVQNSDHRQVRHA